MAVNPRLINRSTLRKKQYGVQAFRIVLFFAILALFHAMAGATKQASRFDSTADQIALEMLQLYPQGAVRDTLTEQEKWLVRNAEGELLGQIIQTSPESDSAIGFSGSTNLLIAFDDSDRVLDIRIAGSDDTRDHVALIRQSDSFLKQWIGKSRADLIRATHVLPVAGATLTSTAIIQGMQKRLGARTVLSKFSPSLSLADAQALIPNCDRVDPDKSFHSLWIAYDDRGQALGWILRTSPTADNLIGYQGPTETLIAFAPDGNVIGIHIGESFDNEPYVGYVRQDAWFAEGWLKYRWPEINSIDLKRDGIEGVSGATMTSMCIAEGLVATVRALHDVQESERTNRFQWIAAIQQHGGTIAITLFGTWFALSSWRSHPWLRSLLQIAVVGYLGLYQGDLLSIAMWVGWAKHGVPWANSFGLLVLTIAALLVPMATKHNVYCSHLCPYGAAQQMLPRRWRIKTPHARWLSGLLRTIRPLLFVWVFCVGLLSFPGNLADIEPFDAFVWQVVAIPSLIVAILGLLLSLAIPMGYCKHACVTGSLINYLRPGTHKTFFMRSDQFALGFFLLGLTLYWIS